MFTRNNALLAVATPLLSCAAFASAHAAPTPPSDDPPAAADKPTTSNGAQPETFTPHSVDPSVASAEAGGSPATPVAADRDAAKVFGIAYVIHPDSRPIEITTLTSALSAGITNGLTGQIIGGQVGQQLATQGAAQQEHDDSRRIAADALVADPAPGVARRVAGTLSKRAGGAVLDQAVEVRRREKIAQKVPAGAYVVDVETISWSVVYFLTDLTHYGLFYLADYAIYEPGKPKPKVNGLCNFAPKKSADSPSGKQLVADDYAALKAMVSAAGDRCALQIEAQLVKLG